MNPNTLNIANVPVVSAFEMTSKEALCLGQQPVVLEVGHTAVNATIDAESLGGVSAFAKEVVAFKFANLLAANQQEAAASAKQSADNFVAYELMTKKDEKKEQTDYDIAAQGICLLL